MWSPGPPGKLSPCEGVSPPRLICRIGFRAAATFLILPLFKPVFQNFAISRGQIREINQGED
jgi:hypothetical protein